MSHYTKSEMQDMGAKHLQGVGLVVAREASTLAVGDWLMYNYGSTYEIRAIRDVSKCFLEIDEAKTDTGEIFTRRIKKDKLVATPSH
jgi:hypothetical protein